MDAKLTCIRCDKDLPNVAKNGQQPIGGLAFNTSGHYGSTYFDPMNGSYLELTVCDECVKQADERGLVHRYEARSREVLVSPPDRPL